MSLCIREQTENIESQILCAKATLSRNSKGRERPEPPCPIRTCFQRDRDRIIHCKSFRRLKHKTQVFIAPASDHYRTRLTHTLEVCQIARTITRALRLNEDLTEAIALGHDLGHTPFGHSGEDILKELLPSGFSHYRQSLRVVEKLENDGKGLNLTEEVRDGIAHHSKGIGAIEARSAESRPKTLEGQIIRYSDVIAYVNHDLDDALNSGLLEITDLPQEALDTVGRSHSSRINNLVSSVIETTQAQNLERITMEEGLLGAFEEVRLFLYRYLYDGPVLMDEKKKVRKIVTDLFNYYLDNPDIIGVDKELTGENNDLLYQQIGDYIAGMTDQYAIAMYENIFMPNRWRL